MLHEIAIEIENKIIIAYNLFCITLNSDILFKFIPDLMTDSKLSFRPVCLFASLQAKQLLLMDHYLLNLQVYGKRLHTWSTHEIPVGQIVMRECVICLLELWNCHNSISVLSHQWPCNILKYRFSLRESHIIKSPKWLKYPFIIQDDRNSL